MNTGTVFITSSSRVPGNIQEFLDASGLREQVAQAQTILIKPNLVDDLPPPITTPMTLVGAVIDYLQSISSARIIVGEGTASPLHDTFHVFSRLGYTTMAEEKGVQLMDLNQEEVVCKKQKRCSRWPQMHLPKVCYKSFLLSMPVLKAHTLAGVTLTLKNMIGLAPPAYFQQGKGWKKASFHHNIDQAIADLNRYRTPDFTLLDASVGLANSHLGGQSCIPPVELLVAGSDPVALDAFGAQLLGRDWQDIEHISALHGELGSADPLQVIKTEKSQPEQIVGSGHSE